MTVPFPKSLDRPLEVLGLRGRWLAVCALAAAGGVITGIAAGIAAGSGAGVSVAVILVVAGFLACRLMQAKTTCRQLGRMSAASRMELSVRHNETLCRILLPDGRWLQAQDRDMDKDNKDNSKDTDNTHTATALP